MSKQRCQSDLSQNLEGTYCTDDSVLTHAPSMTWTEQKKNWKKHSSFCSTCLSPTNLVPRAMMSPHAYVRPVHSSHRCPHLLHSRSFVCYFFQSTGIHVAVLLNVLSLCFRVGRKCRLMWQHPGMDYLRLRPASVATPRNLPQTHPQRHPYFRHHCQVYKCPNN
jgi:hypothetical protein